MSRFIFITGGVLSSLGKGLASASLGALLQARGYSVRLCKLDPYLNVDPGTMNPNQHGEVYVTDDGAETDLDLGHYERFTGNAASQEDNITCGRIYLSVLEKERRGDYLGATIQVIPHITDEIKDFIQDKEGSADFILCEIGGTVGDIEGLPFFEAIRQFGYELGPERAMFLHMTLLPYLNTAGELKTKPTQHSVKELMSQGITPNLLLCRSEHELLEKERQKIALFCNLPSKRVIPAYDVDNIYRVPLTYHKEGLDEQVIQFFNLENTPPDLSKWERFNDARNNPETTIRIGVIGKYTDMKDNYKSLNEALTHGGVANTAHVEIEYIESSAFDESESDIGERLKQIHGILIPGGFGTRGIEGKLKAIQYAREHNIPFFGICLGFQLAVIEAARNILKIKDAGSTEFDKNCTPLVGLMTEWDKKGDKVTRTGESDLGGSMRLGAYTANLAKNSKAAEIYGTNQISERHRHRYEINLEYRDQLEKNAGFLITGLSPDSRLPETGERADHPWFIGVQYHPELKSKPFDPHPLFVSFINAAITQSRLI